uniref:ATP synthase complex subunit 8 n=1 Tax=Philaenus spumarius TaxID=36667 RepID=Q6IT33_PHISP|nr:ATP synthase F0 subunit 8 [Philaenus spumarius]AAT39434.1 ATP synthase FO subunit 8 [Philaenus spumarius]
MPQMAPMWWLSLFMMFILSFFLFNSIIYFFFKSNKINTFNKFIINQMIWKW